MRQLKKVVFFIPFFVLCFSMRSGAQLYENAGDYLSFINNKSEKLTAIYLSYQSAVAHGKSARKVEKRRAEVVNAISDTRYEIMGMPPWN